MDALRRSVEAERTGAQEGGLTCYFVAFEWACLDLPKTPPGIRGKLAGDEVAVFDVQSVGFLERIQEGAGVGHIQSARFPRRYALFLIGQKTIAQCNMALAHRECVEEPISTHAGSVLRREHDRSLRCRCLLGLLPALADNLCGGAKRVIWIDAPGEVHDGRLQRRGTPFECGESPYP